MKDETAKKLAEAIEKLALAINGLTSPNYLGGGIHIHHHGIPSPPSPNAGYPQTNFPWTTS